MAKYRLQKIIADTGYCSRRKAEELIRDTRVIVNGKLAQIGQSFELNKIKELKIDGEKLRLNKLKQEHKYFVLNKPAGVITSSSHKEGFKTIYDFFTERDGRVKAVGRLDVNTEGILLLTTDGELIYRLTHPKFGVRRRYLVRAKGLIPERRFKNIAKNGIVIDGYKISNLGFANIRYTDTHTWFEIELGEGRNREVRKIVEKMGGLVARLKRIVYGTVYKAIPPKGNYRELTDEEINSLYKLVGLKRP